MMTRSGWKAGLGMLIGTAAVGLACAVPPQRTDSLAVSRPRRSYIAEFDTVWHRFDAVYPSFAYKGVDWPTQRLRYRGRAQQARSQDELVAILAEMLAPLRDLHVWLVDPRGQTVPTYRPVRTVNFDHARWVAAMSSASYLAHSPEFGEGIVGGYGYLYIGSWKEPITAEALDLALSRARELPGLILDVRSNAGGTDQTALAFVGRFTARPFTASFVEIRTDSLVTNLDMPLARTIGPRGGWQYSRPVIILAGRGSLSATESFVAAMRTLPHVTVVGDTTGGASGNPAMYALGNGWRFSVPRWLEYGPDRRAIEGNGVAPHVPMSWNPSEYPYMRDPLIDAAVGLLGQQQGVYRVGPAPPSASVAVPINVRPAR